MQQFLDTSILIRFENSFARLKELGDVQIPVIAVGEFSRGIYETGNQQLRNRAERFLSRQIFSFPIVDFDFSASRAWASLLKALKDSGLTMKFGDSLIAAQCIAANASIITSDSDFDRVPGLKVIKFD